MSPVDGSLSSKVDRRGRCTAPAQGAPDGCGNINWGQTQQQRGAVRRYLGVWVWVWVQVVVVCGALHKERAKGRGSHTVARDRAAESDGLHDRTSKRNAGLGAGTVPAKCRYTRGAQGALERNGGSSSSKHLVQICFWSPTQRLHCTAHTIIEHFDVRNECKPIQNGQPPPDQPADGAQRQTPPGNTQMLLALRTRS
ncbi:hypothetical protein CSOJ01_12041 [Colletotrichum sojae]|uniref:Uncharacterized protein n=1 Tax=Colletotrichum sojae TaxID=2175907 RepID=A0A8H6IVT3_9PEZI|nr:hypothetical protein CSOJ01_12041 [Colletotrichum sojae]